MLYDGEHRRERSAVLIESSNVPMLRSERGRWRQLYKLRCVLDDLPRRTSVVPKDVTSQDRRFGLHAGKFAFQAPLFIGECLPHGPPRLR